MWHLQNGDGFDSFFIHLTPDATESQHLARVVPEMYIEMVGRFIKPQPSGWQS